MPFGMRLLQNRPQSDIQEDRVLNDSKQGGEKLSNLEEKMKEAAAALTGKKVDEIPGNLEDICSFIAENYPASDSVPCSPFEQVEAPEAVTAAPTQEDFNGLIEKLKAAKIFM